MAVMTILSDTEGRRHSEYKVPPEERAMIWKYHWYHNQKGAANSSLAHSGQRLQQELHIKKS